MNWIYWALLSALFAGVTGVLAKAGVKDVDSNLATAVRTVVILVFSWIIAFTVAKPSDMQHFSSKTWTFLILSGVATGLSWICYFRAMQLGEASRVAPIDKLGVIFVIILAAVFLKEKITWQHIVGGLMVAGGALVIAWERK